MRIKIDIGFTDLQSEAEDKFVPADTVMTVTKERGEELIGLRLASEAASPAPTKADTPPTLSK